MAEPETGKVESESGTRRKPQPAQIPQSDATKYVGTPAVGTSKAAAAGGRGRDCPFDRDRPAAPTLRLDHGDRLLDGVVPGVLPFLSSAHSF